MPDTNPYIFQNRPKPRLYQVEGVNYYGYVHSIVYNETLLKQERPVVNTDVSALDKDLSSDEVTNFALQSLEDE